MRLKYAVKNTELPIVSRPKGIQHEWVTSDLKHALDHFIARLQGSLASRPRGIQHEFDQVRLKALIPLKYAVILCNSYIPPWGGGRFTHLYRA